MKQEDVKESFYLKKNETKEDGKCPLMATLSIGKFSEPTLRSESSNRACTGSAEPQGGRQSQTTFSAKINVPVSLWASGRATRKRHTAIEINQQLDDLRGSAISYYRELSAVWFLLKSIEGSSCYNSLRGSARGCLKIKWRLTK